MSATKKEDAAPTTFAGATPQDQPIKTQKSGGRCRRFTFKRALARVICCSYVDLGAKEAKGAKEGGGSGLVRLENALVCCSNVECASDVEDNHEIKGGGGDGVGVVDMESVSFWCSNVDLKKKKKKVVV